MKSIFAKAAIQDNSHSKAKLLVGIGIVVVVAFFILPSIFGASEGATASVDIALPACSSNGINDLHACSQNLRVSIPGQCRVAIIADLDKRSKHKEKSTWHSIYMTVSRCTAASHQCPGALLWLC
jgi:hypothetical protein